MSHSPAMLLPRLLLALAVPVIVVAQTPAVATHGTVQRITVHGASLAGNLEGDTPDRDVAVYLPPGYESHRLQRYPVVYLLHGFTDDIDHWWGVKQHFINVPAVMDKALAAHGAREMIVVMPNAFTRYQGSMYSNSVTTGDWETFVAHDLVTYIDSHYRTLADPASRGLAGHSMGGYGAIKIAMKKPGIFSSVYLLSPCCMSANITAGRGMAAAEAIHVPDDVAKADFGTKAALASAAAWSPNPKNPPMYLDLTYKDGQFQPQIAAKWAANAPLSMVDQYLPTIKSLHALAFDAGTQDAMILSTIKTLDKMLNDYGIAHTFEEYDGNHVNHVADRVEMKMLPFFWSNLAFGKAGGAGKK